MPNPARPIDFSSLDACILQSVSQQFTVVRKQHMRSQRRMADLLHLSLSQYKKFENGTEIPRLHTTAKWSMLTGNNIYSLLLNTPYAAFFPEINKVRYLRPYAFVLGHLNPAMFSAWLRVVAAAAELNCDYEESQSFEVIDLNELFADFEARYYQNIAKNLREFRQRHSISQSQVAEAIEVSAPAYAAYESPDTVTRIPLTTAFKFSLVYQLNTVGLSADSEYGGFRQRQEQRLHALYEVVKDVPARKRSSVEVCALMYSRWMQNDHSLCWTRGGLLDHDEVVARRLSRPPSA